MTAAPPVSVVVPAFNNEAFVAATIESILAQTFVDFELVVADHASQDATWDVLNQYTSDPRVRLLTTEAGGGAERNWNRVSGAARGGLLKLVCADDLIYPTCLADQVSAMTEHPDCTLVASPRDLIDARSDVLVRARGLAGLQGVVPGAEAARCTIRSGGNVFGEPACVLLRRDVVDSVGGWSAASPYLIDVDMYLKSLRRGCLVVAPAVLAAFRISSSQWSVALVREQARQTIAFNHRVAASWPQVVSAQDLRMGDVRAYMNAARRRIAYQWWSSRIDATAAPTARP